MVIKELVLHNFGVYKGRHTIVFSDKNMDSRRQPIILIGALNGSGKTTLLDALQLVLYGKGAVQSNRRGLTYPDYLQSVINRDIDPKEGAALELNVGLQSFNGTEELRISRYWRKNGHGINEKLEVVRDGQYDSFASDHWEDVVDEVFPRGITHLFFFDGEKIEQMAEPRNASATIEAGINTLLGLDLVDRLETDLTIVDRRRKKAILNEVDQRLVEHLETDLNVLQNASEVKCQEAAAINNQIEQLRRRRKELEGRYLKGGGDLLEQREDLKAQYTKLDNDRQQLHRELGDLAAGSFPLLLVKDLLDRAIAQANSENDHKQRLDLLDVLAARDHELLAHMEAKGLSKSSIRICTEFLSRDRKGRSTVNGPDPFLNLSTDRVDAVKSEVLGETAQKHHLLIAEFVNVEESMVLLERKLAAVPSEEELSSVATDLLKLDFETEKQQELLRVAEAAHREAISAVSRKQAEFDRLLDEKLEIRLKNQKLARISSHVEKVQQTLRVFRKAAAEKHLAVLQDLILESFQELHRKEHFVTEVRINPDNFMLTLTDPKGRCFDPNELSTGERQLLAVSILWALSKASGRPLPTVIDTPLGRLDTLHRENLVRHYFPNASHQVILLSTDTEIGPGYYKALKPAIDRTYQITFDDRTGSSSISEGYFN